MKSKLNELRLDAGIARIENQQWLCVLDKETGMMIDPLIGLEKFAQLIVRECISMADKESERFSNLDQEYCAMAMDNYRELVRKHFGVEE